MGIAGVLAVFLFNALSAYGAPPRFEAAKTKPAFSCSKEDFEEFQELVEKQLKEAADDRARNWSPSRSLYGKAELLNRQLLKHCDKDIIKACIPDYVAPATTVTRTFFDSNFKEEGPINSFGIKLEKSLGTGFDTPSIFLTNVTLEDETLFDKAIECFIERL